MKQPELMGDHVNEREIVLEMPMMLPATEAASQLSEFLLSYSGDKTKLLFGYWDYGSQLVVTAPAN